MKFRRNVSPTLLLLVSSAANIEGNLNSSKSKILLTVVELRSYAESWAKCRQTAVAPKIIVEPSKTAGNTGT